MRTKKIAWEKVKLLAMDIDGVLTAGQLIILPDGNEIKIWNVKDRLAFGLLRKSALDIKVVWITGRGGQDVQARASEVGVDELFEKTMNKREILKNISDKYKIRREEICFVGDDLADLGALRFAGLAVCPQDAPAEIKKECDYIAGSAGGRGVLREVIEKILRAHKVWEKIVELYDR